VRCHDCGERAQRRSCYWTPRDAAVAPFRSYEGLTAGGIAYDCQDYDLDFGSTVLRAFGCRFWTGLAWLYRGCPRGQKGLSMDERLRLFLCHSSIDKPAVRNLARGLRGIGADVWLDEDKLLPGEDWDLRIRQEVRKTDIVIVCLSASSVKRIGYVQKELKQ